MSLDRPSADTEPGSSPRGPAARPLPGSVAVGVAGALLEAAGLLVAAVAWLVTLAVDGSRALGVAIFLVGFALAVGAALVAAARALRRGSGRARGPLVTWQLLQAATGAALLQAPGRPAGLAGGAVAAVTLAALVVAAVLSPTAIRFAPR